MLTEFKTHIETRFPELLQAPFLLACSGGIDSVVLADLCEKCGIDFALVHCNFQLRGDDSANDAQFVAKLAKRMNKYFYTTNFDTIGYVDTHKVSVQMAARVLRYAWFTEVMQENNMKFLATAHHADDNLETFLINLSRGTGIDGLTGIPEKTDIIARPLLAFSRQQIEEYAKHQNIEWREDHSNADTKYLRNTIRHRIVPELKALHPRFLNNFQQTQDYLIQSAAIADTHLEQLKSAIFQEEGVMIKIPVAALSHLKPLGGYLYGLFKAYGFTEWSDVENLLTALTGKEVRSKTHRLLKNRDFLLLAEITSEENRSYRIVENQDNIEIPVSIEITEAHSIEQTAPHILYVAKNALKYPLTVRKWEKGDYFYPLGMTGSKKLSKFFKDEKLDVIAKENQWLLCSDQAIVWVIGKRADERFKVQESTQEIIKFELNL